MCRWGSIAEHSGGEYKLPEPHGGGGGRACVLSLPQTKVGGPLQDLSLAHSAVGESAFGNNCAPFYMCRKCWLLPRTPTLTSQLGGCPSKFTAAPHLGLFISLWAISRLSQKMRRDRGGSVVTPRSWHPPSQGEERSVGTRHWL